MFEIGNIIKCMDNENERDLTVGKTYKIIHNRHYANVGTDMVTILNDVNIEQRYFTYRFELDRTMMRNDVINEILD